MSLQGTRARRFTRLRWRVHSHLGIPETIFLRPSHRQLVDALGERQASEYEALERDYWVDPDPDAMSAADAMNFILAEVMNVPGLAVKAGHVIDRECGDARCVNPQHAWPKTVEEYRRDHAAAG